MPDVAAVEVHAQISMKRILWRAGKSVTEMPSTSSVRRYGGVYGYWTSQLSDASGRLAGDMWKSVELLWESIVHVRKDIHTS